MLFSEGKQLGQDCIFTNYQACLPLEERKAQSALHVEGMLFWSDIIYNII
jgi:hypothetical protein